MTTEGISFCPAAAGSTGILAASSADANVHALAAFRRSVLDIANSPVIVRSASGRRRTISMFELMVRRMAAGQTSRRQSPLRFIELVFECAGPPGGPVAQKAAPASRYQMPTYVQVDVALAHRRLEAAKSTGDGREIDAALVRYMAALGRDGKERVSD